MIHIINRKVSFSGSFMVDIRENGSYQIDVLLGALREKIDCDFSIANFLAIKDKKVVWKIQFHGWLQKLYRGFNDGKIEVVSIGTKSIKVLLKITDQVKVDLTFDNVERNGFPTFEMSDGSDKMLDWRQPCSSTLEIVQQSNKRNWMFEGTLYQYDVYKVTRKLANDLTSSKNSATWRIMMKKIPGNTRFIHLLIHR